MGDAYKAWADECREEEARKVAAKNEAWKRAMVWLKARELGEQPMLGEDIKAPALDEDSRRALRDFMEMLLNERMKEVFRLRNEADNREKPLLDPFGAGR